MPHHRGREVTRRMSRSSARLAVVPTLEPPDRVRIIAAIRHLEREHALVVRALMLCTWSDTGAIRTITSFAEEAEVDGLLGGLLASVFRTTVLDDACESTPVMPIADAGLSPAFVTELRDKVGPPTPFVAAIVDLLRPTDVVHELWRLPGSQLIYGEVPDRPDHPDLALRR